MTFLKNLRTWNFKNRKNNPKIEDRFFAIMNKMKKTILILIRVLSIGATVSAAIVMATGHENTNILSIPTQANYSDTPAFK